MVNDPRKIGGLMSRDSEAVVTSMTAKKENYEDINKKLSFAERFNYAFGDFGYNFMYYWVSAFMTIYYTDTIGVPAGAVSLLLLLVRIFDAINDPIIGSIADRTKSRWGRYRPWVFIASIVMGVLIIAQFSASPDWSMMGKQVFMWVIYIALTVASTASNMPYGALNAVITGNAHSRVQASGLRMMFANVSSQITTIIAVPMIITFGNSGTQSDARGYFFAVLLTCAIGIPILCWSAVKTKELVQPPPHQKRIPLKKQWETLFRNPPMIAAIIGHFMMGVVYYGRATMLMYYFTYYSGNAGLMTVYGFVYLAASILGATFVTPWLYKLMKHKGRVAAVLNLFCGVMFFMMFFVPAPSIGFWLLTFLAGIGYSAYMGTQYGLIPDAIDNGEYVTGYRCDGFLASFTSTAMKAGGAVGPAIGAMVLSLLMYIPNQAQTPEVLTAMNWSVTLIPSILCMAGSIVYLCYKISGAKHSEIIKELHKRRMDQHAETDEENNI